MKRFPVILAPALLGSLLMLGGCATTGPNTAPLPPDRDCQDVYTVAPGNYIIDIAGGSMVVLDPAVQDFPLFCSPEEARARTIPCANLQYRILPFVCRSNEVN